MAPGPLLDGRGGELRLGGRRRRGRDEGGGGAGGEGEGELHVLSLRGVESWSVFAASRVRLCVTT